MADGGLGKKKLLGGEREAARAGNGCESPELSAIKRQIHKGMRFSGALSAAFSIREAIVV